MEHAATALCAPPRPRDAVVARSSRAFWLVVFALATATPLDQVTDQALPDLLTDAHDLALGATR
jgi:hypothetical protein